MLITFLLTVESCFIFPDLMELPFLYSDGNRTYLSTTTEDSVSDPVWIQGGFPFGNSNQTSVYVHNYDNIMQL